MRLLEFHSLYFFLLVILVFLLLLKRKLQRRHSGSFNVFFFIYYDYLVWLISMLVIVFGAREHVTCLKISFFGVLFYLYLLNYIFLYLKYRTCVLFVMFLLEKR